MEMNRVIPAPASVDVGPVLDFPGLRVQELDPVGVHGVGLTSADNDGPGELRGFRTIRDALTVGPTRVAVAGSSPLDDALPYRGDDWNLFGQDVRHHAGIGVLRMVAATR